MIEIAAAACRHGIAFLVPRAWALACIGPRRGKAASSDGLLGRRPRWPACKIACAISSRRRARRKYLAAPATCLTGRLPSLPHSPLSKGEFMRSIFPSAAVIRQKYALVSSLKAQGLSVADDEARPGASDTFLVMDGETAADRRAHAGDRRRGPRLPPRDATARPRASRSAPPTPRSATPSRMLMPPAPTRRPPPIPKASRCSRSPSASPTPTSPC